MNSLDTCLVLTSLTETCGEACVQHDRATCTTPDSQNVEAVRAIEQVFRQHREVVVA